MSEKSSFWTYIFVLAAGIVLICLHKNISLLSWMVTAVGVMFALPGLIGLISAIVRNHHQRPVNGLSVTSSIGSLVFGVIMIAWPQPFVGVFVYILAAAVIVGGLWQIWALSVEYRTAKMPLWLYILPGLSVIAGVVVLCSSLRTIEAMFTLVTGIAMVVIAANGLFILMTAYNNKKITV